MQSLAHRVMGGPPGATGSCSKSPKEPRPLLGGYIRQQAFSIDLY